MTIEKAEAVHGALAASTLFAGMSAEARAALLAAAAQVALPPGARLFSKGDPGDALFIVVEGEIEICVDAPDGRAVRIAALGPGAMIGEMATLDGGRRSAHADASRRTRLVRIGREAVLGALRRDPEALLRIAAELSRRLRQANEALESAALLDLGGRLARQLLKEAGGGRTIALSQTELARRIGASREKVNRKLGEWRDAGWVSLSRAGVRIEEPRALEQLIAALR